MRVCASLSSCVWNGACLCVCPHFYDGVRVGSPRAAAQAGDSSSSGGPSIGRVNGINDVNVVVAGTGANGNAKVNDGTNAVQQLCGRRQQQ